MWANGFGFATARIVTLTVSDDWIKSMIEATREMAE